MKGPSYGGGQGGGCPLQAASPAGLWLRCAPGRVLWGQSRVTASSSPSRPAVAKARGGSASAPRIPQILRKEPRGQGPESRVVGRGPDRDWPWHRNFVATAHLPRRRGASSPWVRAEHVSAKRGSGTWASGSGARTGAAAPRAEPWAGASASAGEQRAPKGMVASGLGQAWAVGGEAVGRATGPSLSPVPPSGTPQSPWSCPPAPGP